jgi:hypothetical protein
MPTPVCFVAMPSGKKFAPAESGAISWPVDLPKAIGSDPAETVLAISGRRIDPEGVDQPRFPAGNEAVVALRIRDIMLSTTAKMVVCSGACGVDILALETAAQLGLTRRMVLPFSREKFRATSVADRGEDWGRRFDAILQQLPGNHITELNISQSSDQAYAAANYEILDQAEALASAAGRHALAMVVWNGLSRGPTDWTDQFRKLAVDRKLEVIPVSTL